MAAEEKENNLQFVLWDNYGFPGVFLVSCHLLAPLQSDHRIT